MTKKEFIEKYKLSAAEGYGSALFDRSEEMLRDLNAISDLPEQITNEQFAEELQKRLYQLRMKSDEIGLTQQNYDWIKDQLLKGGKG